MEAERLHGVLQVVYDDYRAQDIPTLLTNTANALSSANASAAQADQYGTALAALREALANCDSNDLVPSKSPIPPQENVNLGGLTPPGQIRERVQGSPGVYGLHAAAEQSGNGRGPGLTSRSRLLGVAADAGRVSARAEGRERAPRM